MYTYFSKQANVNLSVYDGEPQTKQIATCFFVMRIF